MHHIVMRSVAFVILLRWCLSGSLILAVDSNPFFATKTLRHKETTEFENIQANYGFVNT